jgi:hypothetical protein
MMWVVTAASEPELLDALVWFGEALEQPAHAHAATMTRTTLEVRTLGR